MKKRGKIRILFLGLGWPPTVFITRKLKVLAESNEFNIVVGVGSPSYKVDKQFSIKGVKTVKMPHTDDPIISRFSSLIYYTIKVLLKRPSLPFKALKLVKEHAKGIKHGFNLYLKYIIALDIQPDIVHFEWILNASEFMPLLETFKIKFTVSARGSQITIAPLAKKEIKTKLIEILKHTDAVHCVSKALEKEVIKKYPKVKTFVIYNGVDTKLFNGTPEKAGTGLNIVFIGNLIWKKSIDSTLYIFSKFIDKGGAGKFHVVGDGPEREEMWFTINDLGLSEFVVYYGKKSEKEVAQILKEMDILLLPSLGEGLANVILEAMATYTVPVVSNAHGNSEPIDNGKNGFVFPVLDMEKPVEYLIRLNKNDELLRNMKVSAREKVEKHFNFDRMKTGHVKFFKEVLNENSTLSS